MADKPDLIKIFGLEGQITPRMVYDDTDKDIRLKTPHTVCGEIHVLIDMLNITILQQDIERALKIVQGLVLRTAFLQERIFEIKSDVDKARKNRNND